MNDFYYKIMITLKIMKIASSENKPSSTSYWRPLSYSSERHKFFPVGESRFLGIQLIRSSYVHGDEKKKDWRGKTEIKVKVQRKCLRMTH